MRVPYAGRVYDNAEKENAHLAVEEFWLTSGQWTAGFESRLAAAFSADRALFVNSGSSANLLMIAACGFPRGGEVITPAVTFPTTVAPLIQHGLVPVFVDVKNYVLDADLVKAAITDKTVAILVPHTLGIPADMDKLVSYGLPVLEDCCDAFGSVWNGRLCGTFGRMATLSFYPAHHITTGEGGAVIVNDHTYARTALSMRDWGRSCWCPTGVSDTCGCRFKWKLGGEPYDHKYIYSSIGYNLKATDIQAAIGCAQLDKWPGFALKRRENALIYRVALKGLVEMPELDERADPCWFGFPMMVEDRKKFAGFLEAKGIETRPVFAGNILKHPGYKNIEHRVVGALSETERVFKHALFVGVYPGIDEAQRDYVIDTIREYFK